MKKGEALHELSLFSGAGGGLLASKWMLGWKTIGYVEINDFCQRVIAQRIKDGLLDNAPIFGDIKTFISEGYARRYRGMVDVVTGGFPCQDISISGCTNLGIKGERSGLWKEMSTVLLQVEPRFVFVENSPMLTIRGLGTVLRDLAQMGYDARWGCISAESAGAPHKRERLWLIAYSHSK
jgi:DNA (cytosine-5)-methyltransferase 1